MEKQINIAVPFLKKCNLFFFLILAAVLGGFFWWWGTDAVAPQTKTEKVFVIRKSESLTSIGSRLKKEGLIRSPLAFKIFLLSKNLVGSIQAGVFHLNPSLTLEELVFNLAHGTTDIWLIFPEGWRKEEFGRRLVANLEDFDYQEFLKLTENLEGYLFPDTYLIPKQASPSAVVKILTDNFEKKTKDLQIGRSELILASIVEREAKNEIDRPIVAGILIKRWQKSWPLQADATIQYAVADKKDWWPKLNKESLKIDSPYNTYKNQGLPPTPICSPGLSSIMAVINFQETPYWFYLSDSQGKIHYARTIEEHNQNIAKYLR